MESSREPLWYKDVVVYQLHVKAFFDSNDDGIGDFAGLTAKLDYLQDLGVTALWLLPFYPSPLRDDGYDIADYRNVNPTYGTMSDFRTFVREAHRRNLKVITELVVNHTSDQHPWFQRARRAKLGSRLRDFYVWSDTDQKFDGTRVIFLDTEKSNWAWDPVAKAYYWHRFYSHQPDLNFDNPRVYRAVSNVMKFWLDIGVDGLRLDAVPYLVEREGTNNENLPETHAVLRRLRADLDRTYGDRMLLAEANQWPEDVLQYFGEGDECHMAFHFPLMPRIYMAVATEDRHPITDIMRQTPEIPENCQWAVFLRNHDELTLEMVTDRERDYLWTFYASDRRARINLGIRRRLAPLMENDRRKIELLNGLLFSMPGTPIVYYGDEIGMGDNIFLGDRDGVRTPMQWTPDRNGGFSRADPARLYLPPIMDPVYGFQAVNVEAQTRSPSSLLNWAKRMISVRQTRRAFGRGRLRFLYPSNRKVLAYMREYEDETILCVANLSRSPQAVELDLSDYKGRMPIELMGRSEFPPVGDLPYLLTLQGHSFFWFALEPVPQDAERPRWAWGVAGVQGTPEFVTLVVPNGWSDLLSRHNRPQLERDVLPTFLPAQRWFAAKSDRIRRTTVLAGVPMGTLASGAMIAAVEVELGDGTVQRYLLPFGASWAPEGSDMRAGLLPCTLAQLRQFHRNGALIDAVAQESFVLETVRAIAADRTAAFGDGEIRFRRTRAFADHHIPETPVVRRLGAEQSNSSVLIEEYGVLKLYRRLREGVSPEVEMALHLTERTDFRNTPPLLGAIEWHHGGAGGGSGGGGDTTALGVLFAFVRNQGEAWSQALDYLTRYLDEANLVPTDSTVPAGEFTGPIPDPHAIYFTLAQTLGKRTAELHRALAAPSDDPAFAPEPVGDEDIASWREEARLLAVSVLDRLAQGRDALPEAARALADRLLALRKEVPARLAALLPDRIDALKTRFHGDYHLGQVLAVQNDYFIIDFEGEPLRSIAERRRKMSPLKDVAGMLRSFDYCAASAVRQLAEIRPHTLPVLERHAAAWRRNAADAFMEGYRGAIAGCPSVPADLSVARRILDFFTLEKAIYEVGYELANRPAWLPIPLAGVLQIIDPEPEEHAHAAAD